MHFRRNMLKVTTKRKLIGLGCFLGLLGVYLFQQVNLAGAAGLDSSSLQKFLVNRAIRFLLNDLFMIGLIYALFQERKYIIFALWVQLAGIIFFLLPYLSIKVYFPSYNGPLISYLHRLILNPTLLLLLIPAFYYQRYQSSDKA